jgi:hypothetical protein
MFAKLKRGVYFFTNPNVRSVYDKKDNIAPVFQWIVYMRFYSSIFLDFFLTLIRMAVKKYMAVRLGIIYDSQGTNRK